MRRDSQKTMQAGFDALAPLYYEFWGEYFHLAIFEPEADVADLQSAYERTHQRYFELLGGETATDILEVACGGGAFAAWMADHTSGSVLGIDLSRRQVTYARRWLDGGRRPNLRFEQRDVMELKDLPSHFDAAVCLDAACYFPDRSGALRAISTRLRPEGRLVVVDWCRAETTTSLQDELLLDPLCKLWAIAELESAATYRRKLEAAGFEVVVLEDLSDHVRPNWERGYQAALRALAEPLRVDQLLSIATSVVRRGPRVVRAAKEQLSVALLAKAAADAGCLRYVLACSRRR